MSEAIGSEHRRSSSSQVVVAVAVTTVLGVGGGGLLGLELAKEQGATLTAHEPVPDPALAASGVGAHGGHKAPTDDAVGAKGAVQPKLKLAELAPIVTNLAPTEAGWVRLQAAIVYDPRQFPQADLLTSQVSADIVAFLRTLTLASIEGADGLRRLSEDLTDRAAIRSQGGVREVIIQALVVQ